MLATVTAVVPSPAGAPGHVKMDAICRDRCTVGLGGGPALALAPSLLPLPDISVRNGDNLQNTYSRGTKGTRGTRY